MERRIDDPGTRQPSMQRMECASIWLSLQLQHTEIPYPLSQLFIMAPSKFFADATDRSLFRLTSITGLSHALAALSGIYITYCLVFAIYHIYLSPIHNYLLPSTSTPS